VKVELKFKGVWFLAPSLTIIVEGPPERVNEIIEAVREKAKEWKSWEEV